MNTRNKQSGFSLIEVMVALALLLLALVGPLTIVTKGIESGLFTERQTVAQFLAQEGIEAFTAARNDHEIAYLHPPNTPFDWTWIPNACTAASGCNLAFTNTSSNQNTGDPVTNSTVTSCSSISNCLLYYNASAARDRYVPAGISASGAQTPYTRVITVSNITDAGGVVIGKYVTSTVTWNTRVFGSGSSESVTLHAALYKLY